MDTMTVPSVSEMEVITRMWNNLLPHRYEFENQFKELGNREYVGHRHEPVVVVGTPPPPPPASEKHEDNDPTVDNETLIWEE
jgi:hypothetical protein